MQIRRSWEKDRTYHRTIQRVDGHTVDITALLVATGAFPIHAAPGNPFGVPAGNGRAAAYGYGLLLTGFSRGTHIIHCIVHGAAAANLTYSVHIT